jgi:NodT family efflux transporter outer membrane factor (OMF) lipoprotein
MNHPIRHLKSSKTVCLAVCLAFSVGCITVGPDYVQPEMAVPDAWHTDAVAGLEAGDAPLERWWSVLDDPDLDDLITRAKAANRDLRTGVWRVEEARALRGVAAGAAYPQVEARGAASRSEASDNGALGDLAPDGFDAADLYEVGVGASWEIDVFGRIRRTVESADALLDADVEAYRDVLVSLLAEVASAYVDLRTTQERLRLARNNVDIQNNTLSLTQDRFRVGLVSGLDVAQAEAILASTEALIPQLRTQRELALNRLAVLLGAIPGSLHDELLASPGIPHEPQETATGLPADLLRQRPDVRRAERSLAAQTARIGIATADLYPSFSLTGYLGLEAVDGSDLFDTGSTTWSFGLPVRWAIFSGGRIRSQIRAEEARTEQALAVYEQTVLRALEEVENALYAYAEETIRRERLRQTVDATERSLDLVMTQYRSGLTNFQNVLDTQRSLLTRQDELAASEGQVTQNLIALYRALGGGWDPEEVPAAPVEADNRAANRVGPGDETPGSA